MILDALLQFDAAINLAQVAGTYASTNVIDLGVTSGIPCRTCDQILNNEATI